MKKTLPIIVLSLSLFLLSFQTTKEAAKKNFIDKCVSEALDDDEANDTKIKAVMTDFCKCAADKVFEKYSVEEVEELEKGSEDSMTQAMMPLIQPCINDMQNKLGDATDSDDATAP